MGGSLGDGGLLNTRDRILAMNRRVSMGESRRGSKSTEGGISIYLASLSLWGQSATASNQQLRYGRLSRMHQLGLFIFWRAAQRCGRSWSEDANRQRYADACAASAQNKKKLVIASSHRAKKPSNFGKESDKIGWFTVTRGT